MKSIHSLSVLLLLCAPLVPVRGVDIVWTNINGGLWSAAANWTPNQVPGAADSAFITNAGAYDIFVRGVVSVGRLELRDTGGSKRLRIEGSAGTGNTTLTVANGFTNQGTIELSSSNSAFAATLTVSAGALVNPEGHSLNVRAGAGGNRALNLALVNLGEVLIEANTTITRSAARHTNAGIIRLGGVADLTLNQSSASEFYNSGTLDLAADTTLRISGGLTTLAPSTLLTGTGTLDFAASADVNLGRDFTLRPGQAQLGFSGSVTVNGPGAITNATALTLGGRL